MELPASKEYLFIDLTRNRSENREIPAGALQDYPRGTALAAFLLSLHQPPGIDPLAPESVIVISPGLLAGTPFPGATTFALACKSPLTGCWTGGAMGGEFGWALARTGWSAVVISGKAPELCCLFFDKGRVFFRKASSLQQCSQNNTIDKLKRDWGTEAAVLCIGPAGEALVRFANLSDGSPGPGLRGGLGAVFGSKNLKALVVRPDQGRSIAHSAGFLENIVPLIKQLGGIDDTDGSIAVLDKLEKADALPGRNFQEVFRKDGWTSQYGNVAGHKRACIGCPISCTKLASVKSEDGVDERLTELALYPEHVWAAGPLVGLDSVEDTARVLIRCREQGLEPISFGGVSAWAAQAAEKGIDIGIDFDPPAGFSRVDWLMNLPELLVNNPEVHRILGQGVSAAAQKIGGPAIMLAAHYEGLELTYADPRRNYLPLSFLGPALLIFPSESADPEGNGRDGVSGLISMEDQWALRQTMGLCPWAPAREVLGDILPVIFPLAEGRNISSETLNGWGRGLISLIKTFDWREGWRPFEQNLSLRFFEEDLPVSDRVFSALDREERRSQMKRYFLQRGWRDDGLPCL